MTLNLTMLLNRLNNRYIEPLFYRRRRARRLPFFGLNSRGDAPRAPLDCRLGPGCTAVLCNRASLNYEGFFGDGSSSESRAWRLDKGLTLMAIDLQAYGDIRNYMKALRKRSSNFCRDALKAERNGYFAEPFRFENRTPDILAVRRSVKMRSFGPVIDAFVLTIDSLGGAPDHEVPIERPACNIHWDACIGVFTHAPGHRQGAINTDRRLIAYAKLRRAGNAVNCVDFIGHGEHVRNGIMMQLHLKVIEWLLDPQNDQARGVRFMTYGAVEMGNDGLFFWKRKALFTPFIVDIAQTPLPEDFDGETYLRLNPDLPRQGVDPAWHYKRHGALENRPYKAALPADFDAAAYLRLNPDVAQSPLDAVTHYLVHGQRENRNYK